jgi:hypothetical protein
MRSHATSATRPGNHATAAFCAAMLVAAALILLCPVFAGAGRPTQHRDVADWFNGVDVVGGWGGRPARAA